ncbi:phage tail protein [Paenibacillus kandeliae]|uniref:phage tail protein n=1 Tax=Paenibacillus kandeliae TaxID=3231269 RepID=UPI003458D64B
MDAYVGEIRLFAGNYAPAGWLMCNGQELSMPNYQLLYAVIGSEFGGNGSTVFNVPNLSGKAPVHRGQGTGLTNYPFASTGGSDTVTLDSSHIPSHTHTVHALGSTSNAGTPKDMMWAVIPKSGQISAYSGTSNTTLSPLTIGVAGGGQAHNNMQPYVAINYIICYEGIFPNLNS